MKERGHLSQPSNRTTLRSILARYHFGITLLAVSLSWLAILLAGMTALKSYANQNLDMAAQLASYSAEPGLVFNDAQAAKDSIQPLITKDGIARIRIINSMGEALIDEKSLQSDPAPFMTQIFLPDPVSSDVVHNGLKMGRIDVWGDSGPLLRFGRLGLLTGLGCLALTAMGSLALARRLDRDVILPLSGIANLAHDVRLHRRFEERVKPVGIAELDRLGGDINALLEELQGWQGKVESERAALTHRATHDPLTTLPNRSAFDDQLQRRLAAAAKDHEPFALIFIDADNFKQANDEFGHAAGDVVLVELSRRIRDALSPNDFAARLGGDEFVVIVDNVHTPIPVAQWMDQLRATVSKPIVLTGSGLYETAISIGAAIYPNNGTTASDLLTAADAAMYADKFSHKL